MKLINQKKKLYKGESEFDLNPVKIVKGKDLNYLIKKAQKTKRKRYRFCLHEDTKHLTQEMIICLNGFTYIRPHRHLKKRSESYHMIKGSMDVYLFKKNGKILDIIRLDANTKKIQFFFINFQNLFFIQFILDQKKQFITKFLQALLMKKTLFSQNLLQKMVVQKKRQ